MAAPLVVQEKLLVGGMGLRLCFAGRAFPSMAISASSRQLRDPSPARIV